MEKCPDCGKQFKSPQALAGHRRWAHPRQGAASIRKAARKRGPIARRRAIVAQPAPSRPEVSIRVGDRDLTPAEFTRFVDEMLMVRAALTRVR